MARRKRTIEPEDTAPRRPYKHLPEELLQLIISHLATNRNDDMRTYYIKIATLVSIARATRQLHRISKPVLWREVRVDVKSWYDIKIFLRSALANPHCARLVKDITFVALAPDKAFLQRGLPLGRRRAYTHLCHRAIYSAAGLNDSLTTCLIKALEAQQWCAGIPKPQVSGGHEINHLAAEVVLILLCCTKIERLVYFSDDSLQNLEGINTRWNHVPVHHEYWNKISNPHFHDGLVKKFIDQTLALQNHDTAHGDHPFSTLRDIDIAASRAFSDLALCRSVERCRIEAGVNNQSVFRKGRQCTNVRHLALIIRDWTIMDSLFLPQKLQDFSNLASLVVHDITNASCHASTDMPSFGKYLRNNAKQLTRLSLHGWNLARDYPYNLRIGSLRELQHLTELCLPIPAVLDSGEFVSADQMYVTPGELIRILPTCLACLHLYHCGSDWSHPAGFLVAQLQCLAADTTDYPDLQQIVLHVLDHWDEDFLRPFEAIGWLVETFKLFESSKAPRGDWKQRYTAIVLRRADSKVFEDTRCCRIACNEQLDE